MKIFQHPLLPRLLSLGSAGQAMMVCALLLPLSGTAQAQGTPPPTAPGQASPADDGQVWGALVYASPNASEDKETKPAATPDLPDMTKRLGKVFPYAHFKVLGQHTQVVFREYESWVVPSRNVFIKLDSKGPSEDGGLNLHLQFWQGQQVLVKTDTLLQPNSPLFIGGPKWRDGQLIFVLLLTKGDKR